MNDLLCELRDRGNTVLVVEHDRDVIAAADHVIDMGPGAGTHGGRAVYQGTPIGLRTADTLTGRRLRRTPALKERARTPTGWLTVKDAALHNLKNLTAEIPTGVLTWTGWSRRATPSWSSNTTSTSSSTPTGSPISAPTADGAAAKSSSKARLLTS